MAEEGFRKQGWMLRIGNAAVTCICNEPRREQFSLTSPIIKARGEQKEMTC